MVPFTAAEKATLLEKTATKLARLLFNEVKSGVDAKYFFKNTSAKVTSKRLADEILMPAANDVAYLIANSIEEHIALKE